MSKKLRVVGVDPALRNFGFAIADLDLNTLEYKVLEVKLVKSEADKANKKVVRKNSDDLERARKLSHALREITKDAALVFVEVPVGSQSARAMASYGICIGVLAGCDRPIIQVNPTEVKLAGTGCKTATKDEMIQAAVGEHPGANWLTVKRAGKLELTNDNEHLADATFAIKAGLLTDQFAQLTSMMRQLAA